MLQSSVPELQQSLTDSEVARRVLGGETELFEILMRRYNQRLYRVARAILKDEDEAEQVMQETHFLAYTHLSQFAEKAMFSTWLTRIAINEALSRLRQRRRMVDLDSLPETIKGESMLTSTEKSPEQKALNSELKSLLESEIERLPASYRSVLILRDVEDLDTRETSECLGISEESVKVRLHRARALMRKQLYSHAGVTRKELFSFQAVRCDKIVAAVFQRISAYLRMTIDE
jgi:RNA polymerase sigma-70 factor, ECF subfamily